MQQNPSRPAPQETSSVSPSYSRVASSSDHHTTYVDPDLAIQTSIPSLSSSSDSVVNPSSTYTPVFPVPKSQGRSSFKVLSRPAKPTITTQGLDTASFSALPPVETSSSSYEGTKGTPTTSGNAGFVASPSMLSPAAPLDPHMFYSPGKTAYTPTASVPPLSSRGTTLESVTHTPRSRDGSSDNVRISSGGETEVLEDDGESTGNSTGSQTPRRRQSGPFGFGFEANQSSKPSTVAGGSYGRHGMTANPGASISAPPTATPRRPSLLTQQILSSPAVPLATRMTASLNPVPTGAQLSKRSSLKEGVKGSLKPNLTTHGELQHSDLGGSFRSRSSRDSFSAHSGELHHPASSLRENLGGSNIREDHMEELRGDVNSNPIRGRARQYTRSRTYTEGSSQDEAGSSAMHGTSSGTWGRSVGGLTTDDDEAVIETQDINFTKDAVTGRKMVNQYVILKEIGRGQHGQVRLGQDISQENTSSRRNVSQTENGRWDSDKGVGQHEGGYWAIKILDRQPRKKLPGVKKLTVGYPGLTGEARQTSVTNEKLKKEIAILKKCRHPNVVRLREVIDAPVSKKIYLVLEYCEGGEVKWKTEEGKPLLTVDQARKIFRDIVLGLEYLHHQGIIHRDIKPANLLYSADGIVKISDFGVSHYSQVLRGQNTGDGDSPEEDDDLGYANEHDLAKTAGSPAFFAPELCFSDLGPPSTGSSPAREIPDYVFPAPLTKENKLDSRSSIHSAHSTSNTLRPESPAIRKERPPITEAIDVWALGVTLYCFLFGTVPFDSISEFHLLSIIPVEDFPVPDYMGADRQYTGGRKGYRKGPSSTLTKEACEVVDLLDKLLEKDPTKRIKLSDVKTHPFTLRGLNDKSVWLTTTGPSAENFVTVSTAEVAAAVTNSNSFRDKFKKGMRNLSNRLFGSNTGSLRSRSRSNSIVHLGDRSMSVSASSTSPNATHPPGSPLTGQHTRWNSGWSSRIPSGTSETSDARSSSPRPNGLVRRLSVLGGKSARSISPLPPLDKFHHISSFPNYAVPGNSDPNDRLGRSMSDRSTTSSSGNLLLGRGPPAGPIRRQSTHLVPPSSGNTDPTGSRKFLSTSNSAERLGDIDQKSSADGNRLKSGRQRAISNASSVTGSASASGLHSKLAKLLTRGSSQKSSSASSVISSNVGLPYRRGSEVESSRDRLPTVGRFPTPPLGLRSRQSVETFASASAMSSRQPSPAMSFHALPPIPQVTSSSADIEDDEEETLHTMDKAIPDLDKADWEGDLSDDDDYGAPVKSVYGGHRAATSWNETPTRAADLRQGTWILNSNGWHGRSESEAVEPGSVGSESSCAVTDDGLGLDSGVPLIESGFSPSHVPPTIAEADVETDSLRLDDSPPSRAIPRDTFTSQARSPPTSPTQQLHLETGHRTYSRGCPSPARVGRGSFRENVNGNLVNRRSVDRFGIGQFQDTFDDADEDDDAADDGLEIDVATKRGRRASKPVTPAMNRQLSLPR